MERVVCWFQTVEHAEGGAMMTPKDALKQGEKTVAFRIAYQKIEQLQTIQDELEWLIGVTQNLKFRVVALIECLTAELPPCVPSDPEAKAILNRSERKELEVEEHETQNTEG